MIKEWIELKLTLQYISLSFIITSIIIWFNKEWYWKWSINHLSLDRDAIIVTSIVEERLTYLRLAFYLGLLISLLSVIGLLWQYIRKGIYNKEEYNIIIPWVVLILSVNWIIYPIFSRYIIHILQNNDNVIILGKMNQYMDLMISLWCTSQLLWIIPALLTIKLIRNMYIKNRIISIYIIAVCIGIITPPDILMVSMLVCVVVLLIEILIYVIIFRLQFNRSSIQ